MEKKNKKVSFIVHPVVEFIYGLDFLANEKKYNRLFQESNYEQDEKVKEKIQHMASHVSRFLEKEMEYFFKLPEILDTMGRIIIENPHLIDVDGFIKYLEKMDAKVLLIYILEQFYFDDPSQLHTIIDLINSSTGYDHIFSFITQSEVATEEVREKLLDMIESPEEIKLRLTLLLHQFYEKCYFPVEKEIIDTLITSKEKYERMFQENAEYFFEEYLRQSSIEEAKGFIVNIGYFIQIRVWKFLVVSKNGIEWINLGMHTDRYPQNIVQRLRVKRLLKLLADTKRFEMVELLGRRAWYGQELAEELGITPPTVSYHINSMMELGLVFIEKDSNRTYYHLDKEKLKQLTQLIVKLLLHEE